MGSGSERNNPAVIELADLIELFFLQWNGEVVFDPSTPKKRGALYPNWNVRYLIGGREMTETAVSLLMNSEFQKQGFRYFRDQIRAALVGFVDSRYRSTVEDNLALASVPRVVIKRPRGRPRKDRTSHTVFVQTVPPKKSDQSE